ncbi:sporulation initiation phosphotransferase B [Falsibacillus pallidus]|uniref:Stage 0 sporulation protein B (Sporulation initiation phosphotransferase) n=1 Tax=Falsibacillus pallidus TaxID=493781 RepID=A0A370GK34_9BACI|nr:sporulation initiation phosphotransferase B [Falsibacillus pallidus]RDI44138.1 stage 0 sporulation protein B (sporulation initiation phosphotransferase) [Falsibacillus pallidus]
MNNNWTVVEVLKHARHDWMNKLQLIKGNLALDRPERAKSIIDEIVLEAQQESRLSNLKLHRFASLLMTFNWEGHRFTIDYDILNENTVHSLDDAELFNWFSTFFALLNEAVEPFQDQQLSITIQLDKDSAKFFLDFRGILKSEEEVLNWLKLQKQAAIEDWSINQFTIQLSF